MKRGVIFYAVGACIALFCLLWVLNLIDLDIISLSMVKKYAAAANAYKENHYIEAVCLYVLLFIFLSACFIPVTVIMTILGGYIFGGFEGGIYATVGATLGGLAVFLLVRYLWRDRIRMKYAEQFKRFNARFKHTGSYLVFLQISPITPTFFINVFTGLTHVPAWTYIWTAFLGMLPGSLIYAYAGEKLHQIKNLKAIMPPAAFFVLLVISCIGIVLASVARLRNSEV